MKTLRIALLGLILGTEMVSAAYAHGPRVGLSVNLGYPVYAAPPPIYYAPPPPVYYVPPPVAYAPPYAYAGYGYPYTYYDNGWHRGWDRHHRHHRGHRH